MLLDVAFLPADVREPQDAVCIVIDALRASSTIATLFGRGVAEVAVAGTIDDARRVHSGRPGALLCGEAGGLPPPGFDYGNSPIEFDALPLTGRGVVMATSNGTRALAHLAGSRAVLVGSMLNVSACAAAAVELAGPEGRIVVVAAGNEHGRIFSLEDTVVAGAFVDVLLLGAFMETARRGAVSQGGPPLPEIHFGTPEASDAAIAAQQIWRAYGADARPAFRESAHGRLLAEIGFTPDLEFCARRDLYAVAPRLNVTDDGTLALRT